jgi:hypothetical protein
MNLSWPFTNNSEGLVAYRLWEVLLFGWCFADFWRDISKSGNVILT